MVDRRTEPLRPECYDVEITTRAGSVLSAATLRCGPHGDWVLTADPTIRFTRNLEDIKAGQFPGRFVGFGEIEHIDFLEMNEQERAAASSYHQKRLDFYQRQWQKARVTFTDGTMWDTVYLYDRCDYESKFEKGRLDAVDPRTVVVRLRKGCE